MQIPQLDALKESIENLSLAKRIEQEGEELKKAFSLFSKETLRLERSYKELTQRFVLIEKKLQDSYTALQEKNKQLEAATKNFETILSHITQGIVFIDRNKTVQSFNPSAQKILGAQYADPNFLEECFDLSLDDIFKTLKVPQNAFHCLNINQENKELELSISFVKDENQAIQGIIFLIKDISEIRRLQIAAARNDRLKELGEMAARLAHEIRNPLGGIQGFASLLYQDLENLPKQKEMTQAIIEGTQTLNNLVSSILDYTKPLNLHFDPVNIIALIKKLICFLEVQKPASIKIELRSDCSELYLLADSHLIYSVFLNLALNAMDAMDKEGMLSIRVYKKSKELWIIFSDTGVGISQESMEKLFTPFFTTKKDGHGLGLAEAHKIIEAHSGKIEVHSECDKGTSFMITLPIKM